MLSAAVPWLASFHLCRTMSCARSRQLEKRYSSPCTLPTMDAPDSMLAMAADPTARRLMAVRRPLPAGGEYVVLLSARLRGVPDRPAPHRWGTPAAPRGGVPGHEVVGRWSRRARKRRASPSVSAWAFRGWAAPAGTALLARHARKSLRCALFTGYDRDGGFADTPPPTTLLLRLAPSLRRCACGAAAVRGPDRLSGVAAGRRGRGRGSACTASAPRPTSFARSPWHEQKVHAFTRRGDAAGQAFARTLGAAGRALRPAAPDPLDSALIFAPWANWFPRHWRPRARAAPWSAPAST